MSNDFLVNYNPVTTTTSKQSKAKQIYFTLCYSKVKYISFFNGGQTDYIKIICAYKIKNNHLNLHCLVKISDLFSASAATWHSLLVIRWVKENMVVLNHPSSRARGHSLNIQKACHLPQIVIALTFLSVCPKAPPGPVRPVCGTAAETPLKKTADSPAPPTTTCTQKTI